MTLKKTDFPSPIQLSPGHTLMSYRSYKAVDSRAENIIGDDDPMLAHLGEFTRIDQPRRVRAWDIE